MAFRQWCCHRSWPTCGVSRQISISACGSFSLHTEVLHSSAPGSLPWPTWRRARSTSRSFPSTTSLPDFVEQTLYEEEFVIAARAGHSYAKVPTLDRFCRMRHLLVSLTGDAHGFVDEALAKRGLSRRIALTVPNFMMALAIIAETDLIAALPKQLMAMHAARFGVVSAKAPVPLRSDRIRAIVSKPAMMDAGVAWLFGVLQDTQQVGHVGRRKRT